MPRQAVRRIQVARHATEHRIRSIAQASDGPIWVIEDGKGLGSSRLLRLTAIGRD